MKAIHFSGWLAILGLGGLAQSGLAQSPNVLPDLQITALTQNGQLTFTTVPGYTNYAIEWAPSVNGPWSVSWNQLRLIQPTNTTITLSVPMFFRVVAHGIPVTVPPGMGYVPGGEFVMGDTYLTNSSAAPAHPVFVSDFLIDEFEVTGALWNDVASWASMHGYQFDYPGYADATNHPIAEITWYDAVKWCNARSEKEGLRPAYYTDGTHETVYRTGTRDLTNECVAWTAPGYRLPTEAEWEKAARGGLENHHFTWPSSDGSFLLYVVGMMANFWDSGDPYDNGTTPVGFYNGFHAIGGTDMRNGFGLHDMAGNVAEFCWDRLGAYSHARQVDAHGPNAGNARIVRGGSWYEDPEYLRCAARDSQRPNISSLDIGFRCVRTAGL